VLKWGIVFQICSELELVKWYQIWPRSRVKNWGTSFLDPVSERSDKVRYLCQLNRVLNWSSSFLDPISERSDNEVSNLAAEQGAKLRHHFSRSAE
jgi:hypothetical protein